MFVFGNTRTGIQLNSSFYSVNNCVITKRGRIFTRKFVSVGETGVSCYKFLPDFSCTGIAYIEIRFVQKCGDIIVAYSRIFI